MDSYSGNIDVSLDLSLSLGPTRQPSVPTPPSVQPVTDFDAGHHHNFMQLLTSSPPLPPSPHAAQPPRPLALVNIHPFPTTPIINSWNVATVAQLSSPRPVVPSDLGLYPPVVIPPQFTTQPMIVPRPTRGPGRPAGTGRHRTRRRLARTAAATSEEVPRDMELEAAPYEWATTRPATVHNLSYLMSRNINVISGQVQCKRCEKMATVEYNLKEKFQEVSSYIVANKEVLRERAPSLWLNPRLPPCESCKMGMKPVISREMEDINWLFLLLGQMLGCCILEQLRYFCDKTGNHRTGAKDRVLYLTYLTLCEQLDPVGPVGP